MQELDEIQAATRPFIQCTDEVTNFISIFYGKQFTRVNLTVIANSA